MDITLGTGVREALGSFIEDCRPNHNLLLDMESQLGDYFVNGALKPDRRDIQPAAPPMADVIDQSTAEDNASSQEAPSNVGSAVDGGASRANTVAEQAVDLTNADNGQGVVGPDPGSTPPLPGNSDDGSSPEGAAGGLDSAQQSPPPPEGPQSEDMIISEDDLPPTGGVRPPQDRAESPLLSPSSSSDEEGSAIPPVAAIRPVLGRRLKKEVNYTGLGIIPSAPVAKKRKRAGETSTTRASETPAPNFKKEVFWATTQNLFNNAVCVATSTRPVWGRN